MLEEGRLRHVEAPLCDECARKRLLRYPAALKLASRLRLLPARENLFLAEMWQEGRERRSSGRLDNNTPQIQQNYLAS